MAMKLQYRILAEMGDLANRAGMIDAAVEYLCRALSLNPTDEEQLTETLEVLRNQPRPAKKVVGYSPSNCTHACGTVL
jgi:predicted TPR repeat methyltransferase